jgi:hypothetical protein
MVKGHWGIGWVGEGAGCGELRASNKSRSVIKEGPGLIDNSSRLNGEGLPRQGHSIPGAAATYRQVDRTESRRRASIRGSATPSTPAGASRSARD